MVVLLLYTLGQDRGLYDIAFFERQIPDFPVKTGNRGFL